MAKGIRYGPSGKITKEELGRYFALQLLDVAKRPQLDLSLDRQRCPIEGCKADSTLSS
jgi:hypothetical protein